jgi:hypothetical protein
MAAAQNKPALEMHGGLDTPQVDAGQSVSFVVTITNTSPDTVRNVRVPFVGGSHVQLSAAWWCAKPAGISVWNDLRGCRIADSLMPGQSATIFGTLMTSTPIVTSVRAVVEWESPLVSQSETPLGRLEIQDWRMRWIRASIAAAQTLALPLVLVLLGFAFQWRLNKLEHSRQEHNQKLADERSEREKRRAEEASERDKRRAEEAEVSRLMLPFTHKYTVEYYADLELAAREATQAIIKARATATPDSHLLDTAFYEWLVLESRIRALNETAAFYFKDPTGESLVFALLEAHSLVFLYQQPPEGGSSKLSPAQELEVRRTISRVAMNPLPGTDAMLSRLESERTAGTGALLDLANWFYSRVRQPDVAPSMTYLRAFRAVLVFEMNRPYSPWFARDVPLKLSQDLLVAIIDLCERLRANEEFGGLANELDAYLRGGRLTEAAVQDARAEESRQRHNRHA